MTLTFDCRSSFRDPLFSSEGWRSYFLNQPPAVKSHISSFVLVFLSSVKLAELSWKKRIGAYHHAPIRVLKYVNRNMRTALVLTCQSNRFRPHLHSPDESDWLSFSALIWVQLPVQTVWSLVWLQRCEVWSAASGDLRWGDVTWCKTRHLKK